MSIELCHCGHLLTTSHATGKKCQSVSGCQCSEGIRTDVATVRLLAALAQGLGQANQRAAQIVRLLEVGLGLESQIAAGPDGHLVVEVRRSGNAEEARKAAKPAETQPVDFSNAPSTF